MADHACECTEDCVYQCVISNTGQHHCACPHCQITSKLDINMERVLVCMPVKLHFTEKISRATCRHNNFDPYFERCDDCGECFAK